MRTDRAAIEQTIRAYAAAWAANDRERWLDTFAESAAQEDPIGEGVRHGRAEIAAFWDAAMSVYESIEILPRDIVVINRDAAMVWTIRATSPKGAITFNGVDVFTFDDSARILSVRAYWERPS
jgi:steroid Delta-isomerase